MQRDLLLRDAVVLQLEIVAVAEKFAVPKRGVASFGVGFGRSVPVGERARDLSGETAAKADQPFAVFLQQVAVDTRFIIETFRVRQRRKQKQILVALAVRRQKREVIGALFRFVEARNRRDIRFVAENRFDADVERFLVKFERAVEVAVVGEREGRHFQLFGSREQRFELSDAVEKRVMRMRVQVNERNRAGFGRLPRRDRNGVDGRNLRGVAHT